MDTEWYLHVHVHEIMHYIVCFILLDEISGKKSKDIDITSRFTSDHQKIHPPSFPTHDSEPEYDEEGNLIVNGVPLKKVDIPPFNVEDYLEEDYPVLKPMVSSVM